MNLVMNLVTNPIMNPVKCYNVTVPIASIDHFDLVLEGVIMSNFSL